MQIFLMLQLLDATNCAPEEVQLEQFSKHADLLSKSLA